MRFSKLQLQKEIQALYGAIKVACGRRNPARSTFIKFNRTKDGIRAWRALEQKYESETIRDRRIETLEMDLDTPYNKSQRGGLATFLNNFETNLSELVELGEEQYEQETTKKRKLFAALSHDPNFSWITMFSKTNSFTEIMAGLRNLGVRHDKHARDEARAKVRSASSADLTVFINTMSCLGPKV